MSSTADRRAIGAHLLAAETTADLVQAYVSLQFRVRSLSSAWLFFGADGITQLLLPTRAVTAIRLVCVRST